MNNTGGSTNAVGGSSQTSGTGGTSGTAGNTLGGEGGNAGTGNSCEIFQPGELLTALPDDGFAGYKRYYSSDKSGFAEAKYQQNEFTIYVSISFDPERAANFVPTEENINGYPYQKFGSSRSNVFKGCLMISAIGSTDEARRKELLSGVKYELLP
jgi:hypothetical protein